MKKDTFKQLILDFHEKSLSHVIPRDIDIPFNLNKTISLIGVRRSGKTFIFFSLVDTLRKNGIDTRNIIYINFEDDRLFPPEPGDLNLLLETYYELFPLKKKETIYLFLDEIQNIPHWEVFARRVQDSENCRIFISGSSAKLLSKEISTALRGRTITYEVFPLSFKEFLKFKQIDMTHNSSFEHAKLKNAFNEYISRGGFPEVIEYNDDIYFRVLQEYLDLIMYKDVIERFKISNTHLLKHLMKFCFINISKSISPNKLYNDFRSMGLKLSKNTIYDYIGYLEDSYGAFTVPISGNSVKEEMRNPKKIYSVDIGFKKIMDSAFKKDIGYIYENIVFLELRRNIKNIFYFKKNNEVDFYFEKGGQRYLVNVCYDISSPLTRKREIAGLLEAMDYFSTDFGLIITAEVEEEIKENTKTIRLIPLWKWLLYGGEA